MNITVYCKSFEALRNEELYALLQLRSEVFVLEQNCLYQDMDDKDFAARHLWLMDRDKMAAYARLLPAGITGQDVAIGRVITAMSYRGTGLGKRLMQEAIQACYEYYGRQPITIGAQVYAIPFYRQLGFETVGAEYLEDAIPHVKMTLP